MIHNNLFMTQNNTLFYSIYSDSQGIKAYVMLGQLKIGEHQATSGGMSTLFGFVFS